MDRYSPHILFDAGESGRSSYERYTDRRRDRHRASMFCREAEKLATYDEFEDADYHPPVPTYYWEPRDYLKPLHRWLQAQVGRHWNHVRSDLSFVASKNNLAGYHFWQHVGDYVHDDRRRRETSNFYVDDDGILRAGTWRYVKEKSEKRDLDAAKKWLGATEQDTNRIETIISSYRSLRSYQCEVIVRTPWLVRAVGAELFWMIGDGLAYRQDLPLTKEERKMFYSFSQSSREYMYWAPGKRPCIIKKRYIRP